MEKAKENDELGMDQESGARRHLATVDLFVTRRGGCYWTATWQRRVRCPLKNGKFVARVTHHFLHLLLKVNSQQTAAIFRQLSISFRRNC